MHNEERNRAIVYEVTRAKQHGLPGMILVSRTEHGRIRSDMLTQAGVRVAFIRAPTTRTSARPRSTRCATARSMR